MSQRIPRSIRLIAELGQSAFQKRFDETGKYIGAQVPRRAAALVRKRAIVEGTYGEFDPLKGGWKPEWDEPRKIVSLRPYKGHERERTRQQRADKITKAMQGMEAREAKYRQDIEQKKPVKNFRSTFKRIERMAKEKMEREISRSSDE